LGPETKEAMPVLARSVKVLFLIAALALLSGAQQSPCSLSQPPKPPSNSESPTIQQQQQQQAQDVSDRSSQLDCVEREGYKTNAELEAERVAQRAELRKRFQALKVYSDALAEYATTLKEYAQNSNNAELSAAEINNLQQMVMMSHGIREGIAGRTLPKAHAKTNDDDPSGRNAQRLLLEKTANCVILATNLKHVMDGYLLQNNQNTVSAVELKDQSISSSISKIAEDLESASLDLHKFALAHASATTRQYLSSREVIANELRSDEPAESSLVLRATTGVVLVDAIVTNGAGKPVQNLKAEDFTVIENGRKEPIRTFAMRSPLRASQPKATHRSLLNGVFSNIPEFAAQDGTPTIIVADFLNTLPADQAHLREKLLKYLQNTGTKHNICIYLLGRQLHLLHDFNDETLRTLEARTENRLGQNAGFKSGGTNVQSLEMEDNSVPPLSSQIANVQAEAANFDFDTRFRITMDALESVVHNSAGYPGRENLIWISSGLSLSSERNKDRNYYDEFHKTSSLLADAQIAIYPVILPQATRPVDMTTAAGNKQTAYSSPDPAIQLSHVAMDDIALWTAGRSFYQQNDLDYAIRVAAEDSSTYYTLGYLPKSKKLKGEFRKIEVKVARDGLRVRHRDGYFAMDTAHPTAARLQQGQWEFLLALHLDSPAAMTLPFVAQVIPPGKEGDAVTVDFGVDPRAVVFKPHADNLQHANLNFAVVAFDEKGNQVKSQFDVVCTHLTPRRYAEIMSGRIGFRQKISLPPGKYQLKLGVRDITNNVMGTATGNIEIRPPS
jgi:VWFA-related protein